MGKLFQQSEGTAAQRRWFFACVDDTDGKTPETGLTFSGAELQISKNGGAFASFGGSATELSDGMYYYEATSGELDTLGAIGFKVEKSGVRLVLMEAGQVVPWDPYLDFTALIDTEIAAIKAKTDNLPSDPADASDIAASLSALDTKIDAIDNFVDTEVAAIVSAVAAIETDTQDIQSRLPAALVSGRMDSSVGAMAANTLTASALAADAVTEIVTGVWAAVMEGSYTAVQFMRGFASALFGESNGNTGASRTYRDTGDTKDRITATVSQHGRSAVTLDLT